MQKLGQHFLKNGKITEAIVAALELRPGDRVIEIGPGHGELTVPLLRGGAEKSTSPTDPKSAATIISIEKDHALVDGLVALAKKEVHGRLTIIEGDALKLLPKIVGDLDSGDSNAPYATYKIAGNIPYYITGKLLRVISELDHVPERTVLMIQKEVAERICAAPPEMNRLAASVQFWADATIVAHVPRKDFSPPPDVDSAVMLLVAKNVRGTETTRTPNPPSSASIDAERYYKTVRGIFSQPRKTLLNNIAAMEGAEKEKIARQLEKLGIDPGSRPQDLSIEQIIAIAKAPTWG